MSNSSDKNPGLTGARCMIYGLCGSVITAVLLFAVASACISAGVIGTGALKALVGAVMAVAAFAGVCTGRRRGQSSPALAFIYVCCALIIILTIVTLLFGREGTFGAYYVYTVAGIIAGGVIALLLMSRRRKRRR